ncbi:MAG: hypothetical protein M1816_005275 [Peltula sp. TS41687]|nr:MAG: hypothetical protein M1816_005275 [Peltula sp. TS41687]
MFSSALKSFSSNISSNYTLSNAPSSNSGPWKIFDAKKKSTGRSVSVFVFDKKSIEPQSGFGRSAGGSIKKVQEEVIERLKKEATSLARLRHPCILELVEPVEDTRNGGLMFATEPATASLAGLLAEKDGQEKASGVGGRSSRFVVEDAEGGGWRRREVEIDDLEIQKGLLQVAKGLEFLHESAGLVHANLTPEAIYINAKSDWKISGLGFSTPPDNSTHPTSVAPVTLWEILNHDSRLPRFVQLNLDYSSPDFVIDSNITTSADLFSLGLLIVALFNSPHTSPLQTNFSVSAYKRLFNSPSTTPSPSNQFLSSRPLPKELSSSVLPRLIARRPAQRMTAREFQQSHYFDNILVSTIRFLDSLPAKTPNEKSQFMRGLPRVLSQFPKSVLEKKLLPALLEEMKDRDLLALILQNVFKTIKMLPSGRRAFSEKVVPKLREIVLASAGTSNAKGATSERETGKEAGLMVVIENIDIVAENCSGKEFKDEILPLILLAMESPTHPLVDASLRCLATILPVLDYTTTRNDLFPVVAGVFSKTNSLGIKIRGLEAFVVLCGGKADEQNSSDGFGGEMGMDDPKSKKTSGSPVLDKYSVQEKVVPLLKAIKTKEPAVMMAALKVFRQVGRIADSDFVATEILPLLWSMCLGPLLNLEQFRSFMDLIKVLSDRVEQDQIRKLQELSSSTGNDHSQGRGNDFLSFGVLGGGGGANGVGGGGANDNGETDFERLVSGGQSSSITGTNGSFEHTGWESSSHTTTSQLQSSSSGGVTAPPVFSWSTPSPTTNQASLKNATSNSSNLNNFAPLTPSTGTGSGVGSSSFLQPLQPQQTSFSVTQQHQEQPSLNWTAGAPTNNPWASPPVSAAARAISNPTVNTLNSFNRPAPPPPSTSSTAFSIPPPPPSSSFSSAFSIPPPPMTSASSNPPLPLPLHPQQQQQQQPQTSSIKALSPTAFSSFTIAPPPPLAPSSSQSRAGAGGAQKPFSGPMSSTHTNNPTTVAQKKNNNNTKTGLDKYESLL